MMYSVHETNLIKNKDGSKELDIVEMWFGNGEGLAEMAGERSVHFGTGIFVDYFRTFLFLSLSLLRNVNTRIVNTRCSFVFSYPADV